MKLDLAYHKIYFTSDTHFGHRAMQEHWRRHPTLGKFRTKDDMDKWLIAEWNRTVPDDGIVFHLGDLSFHGSTRTAEILSRLNGEIHFVEGNHDTGLAAHVRERFSSVQHYLELDVRSGIEGRVARIVLCHYAFRVWNRSHYGAWNLHGHSHGNLVPSGRQLDVGVDCTLVTEDLRPLAFKEIANYMAEREAVVVDHHVGKTQEEV